MEWQEQQIRERAEKERLDKINKQKEKEEKTAKTREIFDGSGIIEVFEEIRDKNILIAAEIRHTAYVKKIFRQNLVETKENVPAVIKYDLDTIKLRYNVMHFYKGEYEESGYAYDEFSIKKIDDESYIFENTRGGRKETTTGKAEEIIDNIAEFIAKTNIGPYEEMSGEVDINHVTHYCNILDEI